VTHAVRLEGVTKRYPRGFSDGTEPAYPSLRHDLTSIGKRLAARSRGRTPGETGTLALRDVSFEVEEGESFALVGPNGAGKSTALKMIARISPPTSGRVRIRGRVAALMEVGSAVHPELTGRENIWLYGQILGMSRADIRRRFDDIVEFSDLARAVDTPVKFFSSGMQLRLGFSIAAHLDPDIFVVDEALAVGDASFQMKCIERMTQLVREGHTLLFVSHSLPVVRDVCRRALRLDHGKVVDVGEVGDVIDRYLEHVRVGLDMQPRAGDLIQVRTARVRSLGGGDGELPTGAPVEIELALQASETVDDAVIGLALGDGRRGNLVTMSMMSERTSVKVEEGSSTLRCSTGPMPLLPGQYEIWFSVHSQHRAMYYVQPRVVGALVITEGPETRRGDTYFSSTGGFGPVHVPFRLEVEHGES
jgi:ABC-type polysaccharide/polyol phosphate transport system ATPase subunit